MIDDSKALIFSSLNDYARILYIKILHIILKKCSKVTGKIRIAGSIHFVSSSRISL